MATNAQTPAPTAPITLIPRQQPTVWGGHLLEKMLGKPHVEEPVGESWEIWDGDEAASNPYVGLTLHEIAQQYPRQLIGSVPLSKSHGRFPLLTKFIDAEEPLSVQVHPTDPQAQELEGQPNGKTEAWHILRAAPGAWIIHGLEVTVGLHKLRMRLEDGTADDLLHKIPVGAGDTVFIPAGTIHAIGPGVLLHEVQQTSDVTYRLYDWNRQAQGSKRELHLDKGLAVSSLKPSSNVLVKPLSWRVGNSGVSLLLATEYFTVKRLDLAGTMFLDTGARSFHILTVLDGAAGVLSRSRVPMSLSTGQSVVVPSAVGSYEIMPEPEATVLVEYVADIQSEVVRELNAHGFGVDVVSRFLDQFAPIT